MKLKDTDYLYATMHIRANEKKLLTPQSIERMIEAKTPEEASKLLSDFGYGSNSLLTIDDVEAAIADAQEDTISTVSDACGNDRIKEVFLLKYDFHNIKAIIKANFTHQDAGEFLIKTASVPLDVLLSATKSGDMSALPKKMAEAYEEASDVLFRTGSAELSDRLLDKACFEMMKISAEASGSKFLLGYVALSADIANLRLAVRMARRNKADDISESLLTCGNIPAEKFSGKKLSEIFAGSLLQKASELGEATAEGKSGFSEFERELDISVIKYMQEAKYVSFDERPVVAYLASREADACTVRIIMSGKIMGLSPDEIRSRLRVV